jgi:dihydroorotase
MPLLLRNARVLDPAEHLDGLMDLELDGGKISRLGPNLAPAPGSEVRDCSGLIVTPGLIDGHVHCYENVGLTGIDPDILGVNSGVTAVVDAGSAGAATFAGLRRYVMERAKTNVLAFVNLAAHKLSGLDGELAWPGAIKEDLLERVVDQHRDRIVGIKIRACPTAVGDMGVDPVRRGREIADRLGLPLMIHIGEQQLHDREAIPVRAVIKLMRPRDIITHLFTGQPGGLLDDSGKLQPDVKEAYVSGLRFDVGHGLYNMSFDTAARVLDQGIAPHSISTDGHKLAHERLVYDLPTTMSKMMGIGFSLPQVVRMTTYDTAESLGRPELVPGIAAGRPALLSVLRLEEVDWEAEDSMGETITAKQRLRPVMTIMGGDVHEVRPS